MILILNFEQAILLRILINILDIKIKMKENMELLDYVDNLKEFSKNK